MTIENDVPENANENNTIVQDGALTDDQINALQGGTLAALGMPVQAKDISPVELSHEQLSQAYFELRADVTRLIELYNMHCANAHNMDYRFFPITV